MRTLKQFLLRGHPHLQGLTRHCLATIVECDPLGVADPDCPRIYMPEVTPLVELKAH